MAQPEIPGTGIGKPVMPYGSDGSNWIALLVDALGRLQVDAEVDNFPADPATQTTLNALLTELKLKADLTETQPVESKDGDKLFGFESIVEQAIEKLDLPSAYHTIDGTAVGSTKVWKITHAIFRYDGTVPSYVLISVDGLGGGIHLKEFRSITSGYWYMWTGEVYIQYPDFMQLVLANATLNDDVWFRYAGVQMNAP